MPEGEVEEGSGLADDKAEEEGRVVGEKEVLGRGRGASEVLASGAEPEVAKGRSDDDENASPALGAGDAAAGSAADVLLAVTEEVLAAEPS